MSEQIGQTVLLLERTNERWQKDSGPKARTRRTPHKVLNVRRRYGRVDMLVSPVGGSGEEWVNDQRITEAGV